MKGVAAPRRLFDVFYFNTEMEMLDIRLMTLWNVVDYFVIMEAGFTYTGKDKPFIFGEMKDNRYSAFKSKIIHIPVANMDTPVDDGLPDIPASGASNDWKRENAVRDYLLRQGLKAASPADGDIVVVSDLDEIPRPDYLQTLKTCHGWETVSKRKDRICMKSDMFYYNFEWMQPHTAWWHPDVYVWKGDGTIRGTSRWEGHQSTEDIACIDHAAWHCSYCFPTMDYLIDKLGSFSHQEMNTERNRSPRWILGSMLSGHNVWDEDGHPSNQKVRELLGQSSDIHLY
ncbi:glycosyl transferase [Fimicolochytrium jonesii]|uniref:glycosyl transferase n=1 Tax=Fimicolochytrium jonesii TaxID=1396493 RepID=UPI0022FE83BB|nr:glycosyl transferase [Fimicolochytrium jonesii]KAI8817634.1 glycosyl transferase [Fimicolochytrium jonesii]